MRARLWATLLLRLAEGGRQGRARGESCKQNVEKSPCAFQFGKRKSQSGLRRFAASKIQTKKEDRHEHGADSCGNAKGGVHPDLGWEAEELAGQWATLCRGGNVPPERVPRGP